VSNWSQYFWNVNEKLSSILVDLRLKDLLRDDHRLRNNTRLAINNFREDFIEA